MGVSELIISDSFIHGYRPTFLLSAYSQMVATLYGHLPQQIWLDAQNLESELQSDNFWRLLEHSQKQFQRNGCFEILEKAARRPLDVFTWQGTVFFVIFLGFALTLNVTFARWHILLCFSKVYVDSRLT